MKGWLSINLIIKEKNTYNIINIKVRGSVIIILV